MRTTNNWARVQPCRRHSDGCSSGSRFRQKKARAFLVLSGAQIADAKPQIADAKVQIADAKVQIADAKLLSCFLSPNSRRKTPLVLFLVLFEPDPRAFGSRPSCLLSQTRNAPGTIRRSPPPKDEMAGSRCIFNISSCDFVVSWPSTRRIFKVISCDVDGQQGS